jgi:hypothetical protein
MSSAEGRCRASRMLLSREQLRPLEAALLGVFFEFLW